MSASLRAAVPLGACWMTPRRKAPHSGRKGCCPCWQVRAASAEGTRWLVLGDPEREPVPCWAQGEGQAGGPSQMGLFLTPLTGGLRLSGWQGGALQVPVAEAHLSSACRDKLLEKAFPLPGLGLPGQPVGGAA